MNRNGMIFAIGILVVILGCGVAVLNFLNESDSDFVRQDTQSEAPTDDISTPRTQIERTGRNAANLQGQKNPEKNSKVESMVEGLGTFLGRALKARDLSPMAKMEVEITTILGDPVRSAQTQEDGTFQVRGLPVDIELSLKIVGGGFASMAIPGLFLNANQVLNLGDIKMSPATQILGKVTFKKKNLAGAHVALLPNVSMNMANLDLVAILRRLTRDDDPLGMTTTDDSGNFIFENIAPGEYAVAVTAEAKEFKHSDKILVEEGRAIEEVLIDLAPGHLLNGIVKDENGQPIANALIALLRDVGGLPSVFKTLKARSGPDGKFQFTQLGKARYNYMAKAKGFAPKGDDIRVKDEKKNDDLEIILKRGIRIRGQVTLQGTATPVAGAEVICFANKAPIAIETVTDSEGYYQLDEAPPEGEIIILVEHEKYKLVRPMTDDVSPSIMPGISVAIGLGDGPTITQNIEMSAGGTVSGQVLDAGTGKPIPFAQVSITPMTKPSGFSFGGNQASKGIADAKGRYEISGVKVGRIQIEAKAPDYYAEQKGMVQQSMFAAFAQGSDNSKKMKEALARLPLIAEGTVLTGQDIRLTRGLTQTGMTVDPSGNPLAGVALYWSSLSEEEKDPQSRMAQMFNANQRKPIISDQNGKFAIRGIRRDAGIEIEASHPNFIGGHTTTVELNQVGKKSLVLKLQHGIRLFGKIIGPTGPVAGVEVTVYDQDPAGDMMAMVMEDKEKKAVTDENGRYSFDELRAGVTSIEIRVQNSNYGVQGGTFHEFTIGNTPTFEKNFTLIEHGFIRGTVVNSAYQPVPNVDVTVIRKTNNQIGFRAMRHVNNAKTDKAGRFEVDKITIGEKFRLRVTSAAWTPSEGTENEDDWRMAVSKEVMAAQYGNENEGKTKYVTWTTVEGVQANDKEIRVVLDIEVKEKK